MFALFARLRHRMRRLREARKDRVEADQNAVRVVSCRGEPVFSFAWADVQRIRTFKLDCYVHDDVRLAFEAGEKCFELSEDIEGFKQLDETMRSVFPTIPSDWFAVVVHPPFATNERILFERDAHAEHDARC